MKGPLKMTLDSYTESFSSGHMLYQSNSVSHVAFPLCLILFTIWALGRHFP